MLDIVVVIFIAAHILILIGLYSHSVSEKNTDYLLIILFFLVIGYLVKLLYRHENKENFDNTINTVNHVVKISDYIDEEFEPKIIVISPKDSVTWINIGNEDHRIKSPAFDSGNLKPGIKFTITFDNKGVYRYDCALHPSINNKNEYAVIVQ